MAVPAEAVLMADGFHAPVMLLVEAAGNVGGALPWQRGPRRLNVGMIKLVTATIMVVEVAHCPAPGVKV